jgi:Ala-tRNA(Pro) deacylase
MPIAKLKSLLDKNRIKYTVISHSPAYTAAEIAESAHIPGKELAKTVMVTLDGKMCMVVLPASKMVHLGRLRDAAGAQHAMLADESEFSASFPDCEIGAMPPFGNLYGMEVFVDEALTEDKEIVFNAGSHTELFRLAYSDYATLVQPRVLALTIAAA